MSVADLHGLRIRLLLLALPFAGGAGLLLYIIAGVSLPLLYTYSFTVVAVMVMLAAQGAALGIWTWTGYTVADLMLTDRSQLPGFRERPSTFPTAPYVIPADRLVSLLALDLSAAAAAGDNDLQWHLNGHYLATGTQTWAILPAGQHQLTPTNNGATVDTITVRAN